jgi:hypothetical protein
MASVGTLPVSVTDALLADEEERLVLPFIDMGDHNRPADGPAKLVIADDPAHQPIAVIGPAIGVENVVAPKLEKRAVVLIRPTTGSHVNGAASRSAIFRRQRVRHHRNLLHAVLVGGIPDLQVADVVFRHDNGGAVNRDIVIVVSAAADPGTIRPAAGNDAGHQRHQRHRAAVAPQGQIEDGPVADGGSQGRGFGRQLRGAGFHLNGAGHLANLERKAQSDSLLHVHKDVALQILLKGRLLGGHPVQSWWQVSLVETSLIVGRHRPMNVGGLVFDGYRRTRDDRV